SSSVSTSCFIASKDSSAKRNVTRMPVQQRWQAGLKRDLPTLLRSLDWMQTKIDQVSMIECQCSIMPQLRLDSNPVLIIRFARLQSALKNLRPLFFKNIRSVFFPTKHVGTNRTTNSLL